MRNILAKGTHGDFGSKDELRKVRRKIPAANPEGRGFVNLQFQFDNGIHNQKQSYQDMLIYK